MQYKSINFGNKLKLFSEHWTPKIIAEMNDYQFKLVEKTERRLVAQPQITVPAVALDGGGDGVMPIGGGSLCDKKNRYYLKISKFIFLPAHFRKGWLL
jgi:hypothetical protein